MQTIAYKRLTSEYSATTRFIVLLFGIGLGLPQFRKQLPMLIAARSNAFCQAAIYSPTSPHLGLQRQLGATSGPFLPGSLLFSAACGHVGQELSFQPLCQDLWVKSKCTIYPKCTRNPPRSPCLVDMLRGHAQEPCEFGNLNSVFAIL